jgi:hypothetical protein
MRITDLSWAEYTSQFEEKAQTLVPFLVKRHPARFFRGVEAKGRLFLCYYRTLIDEECIVRRMTIIGRGTALDPQCEGNQP